MVVHSITKVDKNYLKNQIKSESSLDTLAQLRKSNNADSILKLQKRAKSKYLTHSLTVKLLQLDSPLKRSYWNTYYCATAISQIGTVFTSKYCKNRFCLVCNRIRTAELINVYLEPLKALKEPYFVTLTKPTVSGDDLKNTIKTDIKNFRKILDRIRKRGIKINGIRKLECTVRPLDKFHPHFHLIVETKQHAELIRTEWLKQYPTAEIQCNHIRECDDKSIIELMKYFTKLLPSKQNEDKIIYAFKLDTIFQSMLGQRVYQPFGNIRKVKEDIKDIISEDLTDMNTKNAMYVWHQKIHDWYDLETAEILSHYIPNAKDKSFINSLTVKNKKQCLK